MPPCRSYWIRVSAKCRILAARGLRLAVRLSVLLSISLVFLLSCSSGQPSDFTEAERAAIVKNTCKILQDMSYSYSTFTDMVWLYAEYYPEQRAFYEQNSQWANDRGIRLGGDRPEFRDQNVVGVAEAINYLHPSPVDMRNFCHRLP